MKDDERISMWRFIPPRERLKLLLMLVTVVLLVGAMFGLVTMFRGPRSTQPDKPDAMVAADKRAEEQQFEEPLSNEGPAVSPLQQAEKELWDASLLEDVRDNTSEDLPREAIALFFHYLQQAKSQTDIEAAIDKSILAKDLFDKPAECRGKLVFADGLLDSIVRISIGANAADVDTAYFGRVRRPATDDDEMTREFGLILMDGPMGAKPDEYVALRGYFLNLWKDKEGNTLPILVGKRFDPPAWITNANSLNNVEDGGFGKEAQAMYYAMNTVKNTPPGKISAAADKTAATPEDLNTHPQDYRGKFVSFTGALARIEKVNDPNPTGLREYYSGYLLDRMNRPCNFYIIDPPKGIKDTDVVRFDGMFVKNHRYVSGSNFEQVAPIIIGRLFIPVEFKSPTLSLPIIIICLGAIAVVGVAGIIEARTARARMKEYNQRVLKHAPSGLASLAREAARRAKGESN